MRAIVEGKLNAQVDESKEAFTLRDWLAIGFRPKAVNHQCTFLGIVSIMSVNHRVPVTQEIREPR